MKTNENETEILKEKDLLEIKKLIKSTNKLSDMQIRINMRNWIDRLFNRIEEEINNQNSIKIDKELTL